MNERRVPGVATAFAVLFVMDVAPRAFGLGRALAIAERLAGRRVCEVVDDAVVGRIALSLAMAAALYPRRALCLEQSLALFVLLRRAGVEAKLQIGVNPLPFYAHAWVEVEGRAVNEMQGRVEQMAIFQLGA